MKKYDKLVEALLWGLVVLGGILLVSHAFAGELRPMTSGECGGLANDIRAIATMRDQGVVDEATMVADISEGAKKHIGDPASYIQNEDDIAFMIELVHKIYASKMSPEDIAISFYHFCSTHSVKEGLTT